MSVRPPPRNRLEVFERTWRPFLMWCLALTIVVPLGICIAVLIGAFTYGFVTSIMTGQPMPNLTGGLENLLTPFAPFIAGGLGMLLTGYLSRAHQVNTEIRVGGGQGRPPFVESSPPPLASSPEAPSPTGGLVNDDAIR